MRHRHTGVDIADNHLVLKIPIVLDEVAHSRIVIEDWSREFPLELALQIFFREERVGDFGS